MKAQEMVIHVTEESGESRELGAFTPSSTCDNVRAERVRLTPAPQAPAAYPGRSPGDMLPRVTHLRTVHHAVQFATELVCV